MIARLILRALGVLHVLPKAALVNMNLPMAPNPQSVLDAGRLAEQTLLALARFDDPVYLLARMGQDLSQYGLTYSHLGFVCRNQQGTWEVVHLLNADDKETSLLYREGLLNFFCDSPYRFEAALIRLAPEVHDAMLQALRTGKAARYHCDRYSLTSHPWSLSTQNSNQWVLETLVGVSKGEIERSRVQELIRGLGFKASVLPIGLLTQWAGPLVRRSISFEDQPAERRQEGLIETVTVDSVIEFLESSGMGSKESPMTIQLGL